MKPAKLDYLRIHSVYQKVDIVLVQPLELTNAFLKYITCALYVALVNSDRSMFGDSVPSNLSFTYDQATGKFMITSTLTGQNLIDVMTRVAVDNYKPNLTNGDQKELTINLLGIESNGQVIVYPAGN